MNFERPKSLQRCKIDSHDQDFRQDMVLWKNREFRARYSFVVLVLVKVLVCIIDCCSRVNKVAYTISGTPTL